MKVHRPTQWLVSAKRWLARTAASESMGDIESAVLGTAGFAFQLAGLVSVAGFVSRQNLQKGARHYPTQDKTSIHLAEN